MICLSLSSTHHIILLNESNKNEDFVHSFECASGFFLFLLYREAWCMLKAVLHESIYCDVYIMNEEELLIQICGLHKESEGTTAKGARWNSFYGFVGKAAVFFFFFFLKNEVITWGNQCLCKI